MPPDVDSAWGPARRTPRHPTPARSSGGGQDPPRSDARRGRGSGTSPCPWASDGAARTGRPGLVAGRRKEASRRDRTAGEPPAIRFAPLRQDRLAHSAASGKHASRGSQATAGRSSASPDGARPRDGRGGRGPRRRRAPLLCSPRGRRGQTVARLCRRSAAGGVPRPRPPRPPMRAGAWASQRRCSAARRPAPPGGPHRRAAGGPSVNR